MDTTIKALADEVRTQGFVVLRHHLPRQLLDDCDAAFGPLLAAKEEEIRQRPNRGPMRHYIPLPLAPPFYDKRVFDDGRLMALLCELLGDDMMIGQFATDTPLLGSAYQSVHADMPPLFPEAPTCQHPPWLICVNYPFNDVLTPARGPFEICRGSHLLPRDEALRRIAAGELRLEPLLMEAGDVYAP